MENTNSKLPEGLTELLAQRVEINREDLVGRYLAVLRESLFSNHSAVRPSTLKGIATDEAEALLHFLKQAEFSPSERGEQLHVAGFNAGAILRLSQVTRQFLLNQLENHQIGPMLEIVDTYQGAIIEGFVQSIDKANKANLSKQERVYNSLQKKDN